MKIILITVLLSVIQLNAASEEGLLFTCFNDTGDEHFIEYYYEDENIQVKTRQTRVGTLHSISWFHPYCSIEYTYQVTRDNQNLDYKFISGGQNCEGFISNYFCSIYPIYLD